jgi:REP element-mobilizing transposase RayT
MPQSLSNILVHLVFSTKHRQPIISDEIRERLHGYAVGVLRNLGCPSVELNTEPDHLHSLLAMSRTKSIAEVVEELKSSTSGWCKTQGAQWSQFYWQGGYAAFSVSQSQIDVVREYIRNQREHHRTRSFQDELRLLLKRHGIEFDERYLWD